MTEDREFDRLKSLAERLLSASEKLEREESLSEEEVRALEGIRKAHPAAGRPVVPRWTFLAAAALVVVSVLGFLASSYLWESPPGEISLELAMVRVDGTRSPGSWTSGDAFKIEIRLSEDGFLHLLHLDAQGELEFVFPFYDAASETWDYLGHPDNRVPGGTNVSIPGEDSPFDLTVDAPPGSEELVIAFATERRLEETVLLEIREELRGEVRRADDSGAGAGAIAEQIEERLAEKFPGTPARYTYIVE